MNKLKFILVVFVSGLILSRDALAQGMVVYISTPLTPPVGFWPVPIVSFLMLVFLNYYINKRYELSEHPFSRAVATVFCFGLFFVLFGHIASLMTDAPPPGLGLPSPAFWGFGWDRVGGLFFGWNIYGLVFLLVFLILFGRLWRIFDQKKFWIIFVLNIVLYAGCLTPYIVSGAFTHGWEGGEVRDRCDVRIDAYTKAIYDYAASHKGRFPEADSFSKLLPKIIPYLDTRRFESHYGEGRRFVCPHGDAFEKNPDQYVWNKRLSAKRTDEPDVMRDVDFIIICPYHGQRK